MDNSYYLSQCKELPSNYLVNIVEVDGKKRISWEISNSESINGFHITYDTSYAPNQLSSHTEIVGKDPNDWIHHSQDMYTLSFLSSPLYAIDSEKDYTLINLYDGDDCYDVDTAQFASSDWVVFMTRDYVNFGMADTDSCQKICANELVNLSPDLPVFVSTWFDVERLINSGNVAVLVIDGSYWDEVSKKKLLELYDEYNLTILGINIEGEILANTLDVSWSDELMSRQVTLPYYSVINSSESGVFTLQNDMDTDLLIQRLNSLSSNSESE